MKIKCPTCKKKIKWEDNPFRPFCSERCKLIDLGSWAMEKYRIDGKPEDELSKTHSEKGNDNA